MSSTGKLVMSSAGKLIMSSTGKFRAFLASASPKQNKLLATLPEPAYESLLPHLEFISMPVGLVLRESGIPMRYVYFPTTCIASTTHLTADGNSVEIAATGNEGLVGTPIIMGGRSMPSQVTVQIAGSGYRVKADIFEQELDKSSGLRHVSLHFTQALMTQKAQTAICNQLHSLDQQLCRWLLLRLDRLRGNEMAVTQEAIANMLGVRREGVTIAASKLHEEGIIQRKRGHITVADRTKLEQRVCECYTVVKTEYDRLLDTSDI